MYKVPSPLPLRYVPAPGSVVAPATSPGSSEYDVAFQSLGFRLSNGPDTPIVREMLPIQRQRIDQAREAGEQTLTNWWLRSQSSFHGGVGQIHLEPPVQDSPTIKVRYDQSQNCDVWTPGSVTSLPGTRFTNFGSAMTEACAATVGGIDYAIVGGVGGLWQVAWLAGTDAAPTVTAIDLTGSTYGGAANCNVTSLTTDGTRYFGIVQLTAAGYVPGVLTYIVSGTVGSTAAPNALFEAPTFASGAVRTNLCINPDFETGTAGWFGTGSPTPSLATSTTVAAVGTQSLQVTATGAPTFLPAAGSTFSTVIGQTYTVSASVYAPPTGITNLTMSVSGMGFGSNTSLKNQWVRLTQTFVATATTHTLSIIANNFTVGLVFYIDACLVEQSGSTGAYFSGATASTAGYTYAWTGTVHGSTSVATPVAVAGGTPGVVAWVKERLMGGLGTAVYELDVNAPAHSALPGATYNHPNPQWVWSAIADSPVAIVASGDSNGNQSSVLKFTLDTSGSAPVLRGGATIATLPTGEKITSLGNYLGSFLAIGTNRGVRIGTFDTYTGAMKYGPLAATTLAGSVFQMTSRDRFVYAGFSNGNADGVSGLLRLDLTTTVDGQGRQAWAPDLRASTVASSRTGVVSSVAVLPLSQRLMFITPAGMHVETDGTVNSESGWLRTSRIRYEMTEPKLFKLGRVRGQFTAGKIQVTATNSQGTTTPVLTYRASGDPAEFPLPGLGTEWLQVTFTLDAGAVLSSYQVKALPGTRREEMIQVVVACSDHESSRSGQQYLRRNQAYPRFRALMNLAKTGDEFVFQEFQSNGVLSTNVVIEQCTFKQSGRPLPTSSFGGDITVTMRTVDA